jgi:GDP-L-fucose synthase
MVRYYVAGHQGMVGSAIHRQLKARGEEVIVRSRGQLDLLDQQATRRFFTEEKPDVVILAAAKVGGIVANSSLPALFIEENLSIELNVIQAAFRAGVEKLLFLGSSCIYPRLAPQPIPESALLTGPLEATNEPYAIAKIAGIKLCESYNRQYGTDYRSVMPSNIYGPGDTFNPQHSHVLPALLLRFHEAVQSSRREVTVWGSGQPRREFLHVDDVAEASLFVLAASRDIIAAHTTPMCSHINVGAGDDVTIAQLARMVADITGFAGTIVFDSSKPDGTPRKLLDVSRLSKMGWTARRDLREGISETYRWFRNNLEILRVG